MGMLESQSRMTAAQRGNNFVLTPCVERTDQRRIYENIYLPLDDNIQLFTPTIFPEDQIVFLKICFLAKVCDQLQLCWSELIEDVTLF